ncbi:MAG: branched-chain-amino-acid transaminase [Candidatus Goldiibacteriota bacterium HGW-Goldbacteria-1]|jgi:branched-chain amino acid aminotransferase|nr:MAG: branched-chain-amino-acid transaminase [Candidatus Goldiibacteriota bacterium HGW-Goldbacteria-1]
MLINLNGKMVPKEKAVVSVFDHGLLYGDGIFEGIRVYSNNVFRLRDHIERLYDSAKFLNMDIGMKQEDMIKQVVETVKANKLKDGYIRLVVTRGVGDLGLDPRKCTEGVTFFIIAANISLYPEELYKNGMFITTVAVRRNLSETLEPRVKSLNYLNNILAKMEAGNHGSAEAIMINNLGHVAEATGDNVFHIKKGKLYTPTLTSGALGGMTRRTVLEIGEELKMDVFETIVTRYDLYTADECFLTGTAAKVIPVTRIDGRAIGEGVPGPFTKKILAEFKKKTVTMGVKVK